MRDGEVVTDASKRSRQDQSIRGYKKMLREDPDTAPLLEAAQPEPPSYDD